MNSNADWLLLRSHPNYCASTHLPWSLCARLSEWLCLFKATLPSALSGCDENLFTFAVSTLVSSFLWATPPMQNAFTFPLAVLNPKDIGKRGPPSQGALGGKRGLTRCELKRPSFGCLTQLTQMGRQIFILSGFFLLTHVLFYFFISRFRSLHVITSLVYPMHEEKIGYMSRLRASPSSTAIGLWKHRIPSDLRS